MKTREEILSRSDEITVINDGQVCLPVLTESLEDWEENNGPLSKNNSDEFWTDLETKIVGEFIPNITTDLQVAGAAVRTLLPYSPKTEQ